MTTEEILHQIDQTMTEVDLLLYEWQEGLDMMSFVGYNAAFELWTCDDPPVVITSEITTEALVAAAGKELRVMNYLDGSPTQVGTAVISPDGTIVAKLTKDVPEMRNGTRGAMSLVNPPFEGPNKPLTPFAVDLETHPFFKEGK